MQSEERQECPDCAELVPVGILVCPLCGAELVGTLRPGDISPILDAIRQDLDQHMQLGAYAKEVKIGSSSLGTSTIVLGAILALCVIGFFAALNMEDAESGGAYGALVFFCGVPFFISFLVALSRDLRSRGLHQLRDPELFTKRFLVASLYGRERRAYAATVPACRMPEVTRPVEMGKVPQHKTVPQIVDFRSFRKYWRGYIRVGPSLESRGVSIREVGPAEQIAPRVYVVQACLAVRSYPSLLALGGALIALLAFRRAHRLWTTKVVIEHRDRLFMLEPEFAGTWDRALGAAKTHPLA